jgi:hypothetical protein
VESLSIIELVFAAVVLIVAYAVRGGAVSADRRSPSRCSR